MATFKIVLAYFSDDGGWTPNGSPATSYTLPQKPSCSGLGDDAEHAINFTYQGDAISIDGGAWQDDWPVGFVVETCQLAYVGAPNSSLGRTCDSAGGCSGADANTYVSAVFNLSSSSPTVCSLGGFSGGFDYGFDISGEAADASCALTLKSAILTVTARASKYRITCSPGSVTIGGDTRYGFVIEGTYSIAAWWYSEDNDDYVFGDDPGGDYEEVDNPVPRIDSITPTQGPVAGGTEVTITGNGFFRPDGEAGVLRVLFDGEFEGTDVEVAPDGKSLTCLTPGHWAAITDVTVETDFEE